MKQYTLIRWHKKDTGRIRELILKQPRSEWIGLVVIMMLLIEVQTKILTIATALFFITGFFHYQDWMMPTFGANLLKKQKINKEEK